MCWASAPAQLYSLTRDSVHRSTLCHPNANEQLTARAQPEPLRSRHAPAPPGKRGRGPVPTQPVRLPLQETGNGVRAARRRAAYVPEVRSNAKRGGDKRVAVLLTQTKVDAWAECRSVGGETRVTVQAVDSSTVRLLQLLPLAVQGCVQLGTGVRG